jgi:hypothetical protein
MFQGPAWKTAAIGLAALAVGGGAGAGLGQAGVYGPTQTETVVETRTEYSTETKTVRRVRTVTETVTEPRGELRPGDEGGGSLYDEDGDECHDSYVGECLDPASYDYDCGSGSGDGPDYTSGPVDVVGYDEYDLDRNGDGIACDF